MTASPLAQLQEQTTDLLATVAAWQTLDELLEGEVFVTGKRSILSALQKSLGSLEPEARKGAGAQLQEARRSVEAAVAQKRAELESAARIVALEADRLDLGDVVSSAV